MLAWGMLSFGSGYNKSGTDDLWNQGKATLKWNTDYLLKTIKDDPDSSALSTKPEFFIVYQVCGHPDRCVCMWCLLLGRGNKASVQHVKSCKLCDYEHLY